MHSKAAHHGWQLAEPAEHAAADGLHRRGRHGWRGCGVAKSCGLQVHVVSEAACSSSSSSGSGIRS
jgi:hypothetical protein